MKPLSLIIVFVLLSINAIFAPTTVYAQSCESITDLVACGYTPNCFVSGGQCITNPNPNPVNYGEVSSIFALIDPLNNKFPSSGSLINAILPYLLTAAGLVLFAMLIMGGFTMLTAVSDPKKAEAGKQQITTAIVGFIIIFCAYWLTQILEIVLGITIF